MAQKELEDRLANLPFAALSDTDIFKVILARLLELRENRGSVYGDSWKQYGLSGTIHDLLKKADRLRSMTMIFIPKGPTGQPEYRLKEDVISGRIYEDVASEASTYDCIRDSAVYSILAMTLYWRYWSGDPSIQSLLVEEPELDEAPPKRTWAEYTCPVCQSGMQVPSGVDGCQCQHCRAIIPVKVLKEGQGEGKEITPKTVEL